MNMQKIIGEIKFSFKTGLSSLPSGFAVSILICCWVVYRIDWG